MMIERRVLGKTGLEVGVLGLGGLTEWLSEERVGKLFADTSHCADCGLCEAHCPRELPIRQRLESARQRLAELNGHRV